MSALDPASLGLADFGTDVTIYEWVRITGANRISVGDHVLVDDFVFLQGGERLEIGSYVHIASYASVTGGASESWDRSSGSPPVRAYSPAAT